MIKNWREDNDIMLLSEDLLIINNIYITKEDEEKNYGQNSN